MKRLSIVMLVILCTGCSFQHRLTLYKDYQRIKVGFPIPPDIKTNKELWQNQDTNTNTVFGVNNKMHGVNYYAIHTYTVHEYAAYQLANDGNVISKWYIGGGLEASVLVLWHKERYKREGEILLNLNPDVVHSNHDILQKIEQKYSELWGGGVELDEDVPLTELLKLAMNKGVLAKENFRMQQSKFDKIFPVMESSIRKISRTSSGPYYFLVEHRLDRFLIVDVIYNWIFDW